MPGITLPPAPAPIGAYERGLVRNGIGCLSGQFPLVGGVVVHPGRLGAELTIEQGQEAARCAALNALAQLEALLGGREDFLGLLRLDGVVACTPDFTGHAEVLDGASRLLLDALGERGRHARAVLPVPRLPLDAAVELMLTFAVRA